MTEEDKCIICWEKMTDKRNDKRNQIFELECSHHFHTKCLLEWYKQSTQPSCPICRGIDPTHPILKLNTWDLHARTKILRRKARNKNAPFQLKKAVEKIKKAELKLQQINQELKDYKTNDVKTIIKNIEKFRNKKWKQMDKIYTLKTELGLFQHPNLGPLVIEFKHFYE